MATLLAEAIEIITDSGTGIPVPWFSNSYGLATDGHFVWITDRFTITTATGDSTRTDWVKNILTLDYGNWTLSRNIDFVEAGAMESVSDFTVGIMNVSGFRAWLQAHGIYLGRRRVKYYRATSSDGSTWNFTQRWEGVVDDQPFNELRQSLKCVNTSKDIFGTLPVQTVNHVTFPDAPPTSQDKMVPIVMGRVAYSPMVSVSRATEKPDLTAYKGKTFKVCPAIAQDAATRAIILLSGDPFSSAGINFQANDLRLVGKYLNVVVGRKQAIRILSNTATAKLTGATGITTAGYYGTTLILAEPLDTTDTPFYGYLPLHLFPGVVLDNRDKAWYFEVLDLNATLLASQKPVSALVKKDSGRIRLQEFRSDTNTYVDLSELQVITSETNIDGLGYPGVRSLAKSANESGALLDIFNIRPTSATVTDLTGWATTDGLVVGSPAPKIIDGAEDASHVYTLTASVSPGHTQKISFKLGLPPETKLKNFEALYLLLDFRHKYSAFSSPTSITLRVWGFDIYGQVTSDIISYNILNHTVPASWETFNRLPGSFFGVARDDSAFYSDRSNYDLSKFIQDAKQFLVYENIGVEISITSALTGGGETYTIELQEIGLVGKIPIDVSGDPLYVTTIGETFGTTWNGRKTPTDPILKVIDAIEHGIRNYDEPSSVWLASHTYSVGDKVRSTADNGHIFVCTVAGISSGSEPAWATTAGATYTDGGVTWKEHHEIPIDTGVFDTASYYRADWNIGRALRDRKPSRDYYQTLLAQSFLLGVFKPDGKLQVKAWLDTFTPLIAFDESNILPGTLGDMQETPVRRIYNLPTIQYDQNPGSNGFNKQIAVTSIDKPVFPGPSETVVSGTPLSGTFSVTGYSSWPAPYALFQTSVPHGLNTGDYVSLTGNTDGFNFDPSIVGVIDTTHFVIVYSASSWTTNPSTSGTLLKNAVARLKWKDYVAGIDNYATAKDLWQQCRASYIITMKANPLPEELGKCEWFFDAYAKDANGKYIWSDDGGLTVSPALDTGDMHAAYYFAYKVASWTAWKKKQITFETADNATFSERNLGDCVSFSDQKLTSGFALIGWIHEKTQLPRTKTQTERFRWGITLYPEALNTSTGVNIIDEHGATDVIDEHTATNIIDEHGA